MDANGNIHVFEVKNGKSRFTKNQRNSNVFDKDSTSNLSEKGGDLNLNNGKQGSAKIAASDSKISDMNDASNKNFNKTSNNNMTFHTLWYNV